MLLKEADVEDIMQTGAFRELQTIRHTSNAPEHPERPGPTRPELVPGTGVEGLRRAVKEAQTDPRADLKLHIPVVGVVVLLRQLLRLEETLSDLSEHLIPAAEKGIRSLSTRGARPVQQNGRRGTAVHHLEWHGAKGGMEGRIITILRP